MVLRAFLDRKEQEGLVARESVEQLPCLPGVPQVALGVDHERRAGDLLGDPRQRVVEGLEEIVGRRRGPERKHPILYAPPGVGARVHHRSHHLVGPSGIVAHPVDGGLARHAARQPGRHEVEDASVGDARREPALERRGPRSQVAAEADAQEGDALRIDRRKAQHMVDDRRDHRLPVRPEAEALLADHRTLPRSLEREAVDATGGGGHRVGTELLLGTVIPGVHDKRGSPRPGLICTVEVAGKRRTLVRDGLTLDGQGGQAKRLLEAGPRAAGKVDDARVARVAVQVELGGAVVVRSPKVGRPGADPMAALPTSLGNLVHPLSGLQPLGGPALEVALPDAVRGRQNLASLSITRACRAEQPDRLEVELGIIEDDMHCCLTAWGLTDLTIHRRRPPEPATQALVPKRKTEGRTMRSWPPGLRTLAALVLARIIEPLSKLDSLRVLEEASRGWLAAATAGSEDTRT